MLKKIRSLLPKHHFVRSVTVLVGGTAGSQALLLLAAPVLTRIYTPDDFGHLAVFVGLLAVFTVIANLRYELAIPLPEDDQESVNILLLCLTVLLATSALVCCLVWLFGSTVAELLGVEELSRYLWLLPVGVLLGGAFNVFHYWALRKRNFGLIARSKLKQAIGMLIMQLAGFKLNALGLMLGQTASQGLGSLALARPLLKRPELKSWEWRDIRTVASKYSQFPLYSSWGALSNTAGSQLPPLMFAALFGGGAAGLYMLAHRVLAMPMSIVGAAIGNVFFSGAAEANRNGELGELVKELHHKLSNIAMPPMLALMFAGPDLFALVFGQQWYGAGEMARWMALWVYIVFITSPLSTLFSVLGKEHLGMWFQGALMVSRAGAIWLGYMYGDSLDAVIFFSAVSVLFWVAFLAWVLKITGNDFSKAAGDTVISLFIASLCLSPLMVVQLLTVDSPAWFAGLLLAAIFVGARYLVLFKRAYK